MHAVGRPGRDAWPNQADLPNARFLTRRGFDDTPMLDEYTIDDEGRWLTDQADELDVVVGHSWSAAAVLTSLLRGHQPFRAAVLIEPHATFVSPDHPVVKDHVAALSPAFVDGLTLAQFRDHFSAGMGFQLPAPDTGPTRASLEILRRHRPPWETELAESDLGSLATRVAVVTSGEDPLFEVIARQLASHPLVTKQVISGGGHRPQDTPEFNDFLSSWSRSEE